MAEALEVNTTLEQIGLEGNHGIWDRGAAALLEALKVHPNVRQIDLGHRKVCVEAQPVK